MKKVTEKRIKLIIFDFDGTIADSFEFCYSSINDILKKRKRGSITKKESSEARNLSAKEAFKYFKISNYQVPFVLNKIFKQISEKVDEIEMFDDFPEILETFKKNDIKVILLTSNIKKTVQKFICNKKIDQFFDAIYFKSGVFSKHTTINKIIKKYKLKKEEVLLVGDEVRDIEAARKSGIKVAAVSWGYNTKDILLKSKPDFLFKKPLEILNIIKK